jgi:mono/diheme cytochrome c family protein
MKTTLTRSGVLIILMMFAAACGSAATSTEPGRSTVTPIPVYQYTAPTEPPQMATVAAITATTSGSTAELDPQRVERGRDRYIALECGACHGENGEGTDEGSVLIGLTLSEEEFVSFMRSGGALGAEHQYSTNRLSDTGGRNLYQYLLSLNSAQ